MNLNVLKNINTYKLTVEEYAFAYYLYEFKNKNEEYEIAFKEYYLTNQRNVDFKKIVDSLEALGYIINGSPANTILLKEIAFTDAFFSIMFVDKDKVWNEVLNIYPTHLVTNNFKAPLLLFSKSVSNMKDYYFTKILQGGKKELHYEFTGLVHEYYQNRRLATNRRYVKEGFKLEKMLYSWEVMKILIEEEIGVKRKKLKYKEN